MKVGSGRPLVVNARQAFATLVAFAALSGLGGCPAPTSGDSVASAPPEILAITPSSGPAGIAYPIEVTIQGRGFASTGNVVNFGSVKLPDVPSPDGQHISFFVPKEIPSRGEVPPLVLPRGEYPVTVTTPAGTSPAVLFTLTSRP